MAKARMLHKKISLSLQVDKLSLEAQLLYTWMISHADDEGKLRGETESIKGTVIPLKSWSVNRVHKYIEEIHKQGLIYYWEINNEKIIQFVNWSRYQSIRKDRFIPSILPSHKDYTDSKMSDNWQPNDNQESTQANKSEYKQIETNNSEIQESDFFAEIPSYKKNLPHPKDFDPTSGGEFAAKVAWGKLEPENPNAFYTTYLNALKKGLPEDYFFIFTSEIEQDPSIKNMGAVFNKKVNEYLNR